VFPDNAVLLIDTYDTAEGARRAVQAARGRRIKGVRLDSGDLRALAFEVRAILDAAGLTDAIIFASGNLDEDRVAELVRSGAPIDSFGVGTSLVTAADHPYLDAVYKLQEYAGRARRKRSAGKATWPGRKQVFRHYDGDGRFARDVVSVEGDALPGEPLVRPVMAQGRRLPQPALGECRARALAQLALLPEPLRSLEAPPEPYPVEIAPALQALARAVDAATP
jgi:nicotinate phosphoribosyltransferase